MDNKEAIKHLRHIGEHPDEIVLSLEDHGAVDHAITMLERIDKLEEMLDRHLPEQDPLEEDAFGRAQAYATVKRYIRTGRQF